LLAQVVLEDHFLFLASRHGVLPIDFNFFWISVEAERALSCIFAGAATGSRGEAHARHLHRHISYSTFSHTGPRHSGKARLSDNMMVPRCLAGGFA
jgi:hypothetical protein